MKEPAELRKKNMKNNEKKQDEEENNKYLTPHIRKQAQTHETTEYEENAKALLQLGLSQ